jgi:hypothetical protein
MFWGQPKQATSATMSIMYITIGALINVWTIVYYIYLKRHGADDNTLLWVYGFFFSGIVLVTIGFALGWIGRVAKQAEVAPPPPTINAGVGTIPGTTAPNPTTSQVTQPVVLAVPAAPAAPAPAPPAPSVTPQRPTPSR